MILVLAQEAVTANIMDILVPDIEYARKFICLPYVYKQKGYSQETQEYNTHVQRWTMISRLTGGVALAPTLEGVENV